MPDTDYQPDEQDQAEAFDEDMLDGDDRAYNALEPRTFEELPDLLDVTQAAGDADEDEPDPDFDPDAVDLDEELSLEGVEPEADELYGAEGARLTEIDQESNGLRADDEVELVYSGLMEEVKGAQASAAHWESRRLSDDDIADLGYGPADLEEPK